MLALEKACLYYIPGKQHQIHKTEQQYIKHLHFFAEGVRGKGVMSSTSPCAALGVSSELVGDGPTEITTHEQNSNTSKTVSDLHV